MGRGAKRVMDQSNQKALRKIREESVESSRSNPVRMQSDGLPEEQFFGIAL